MSWKFFLGIDGIECIAKYMNVCLYISLSVCLSVYVPVYLSIYPHNYTCISCSGPTQCDH